MRQLREAMNGDIAAQERLSRALIKSGLIGRYLDYAAQAGVPKESPTVVSLNWAWAMLQEDPHLASCFGEDDIAETERQ